MATTTFDQAPSQGTDALFRLWGGGLSTAIQAVGFTPTGDTGQVNWTTVTHPLAINTKMGYEIYKFADTLAATQPLYLRIDYGSAGAATSPSLWITLGTGSDGAGTITAVGGSLFGPQQIFIATNSATTYRSYVSGVNAGTRGALRISLWVGTSASLGASTVMHFMIERTKNSAGADTASGAIALFCGTSSGIQWQYYKPINPSQPVSETRICAAVPTTSTATMVDGIGVGVALPVPLSPAPQQPGTNFMIGSNTDYVQLTAFPYTLYGTAYTFLPMAAGPGTVAVVGTAFAAVLLVQFQ